MGQFANTFNAIATAIKTKDMKGDMTPAQMAGRIAALPTIDPYYNEHWNPEPWMPNLRRILTEDTETRWTYKYATLLVNKSGYKNISRNRFPYASAIRVGNGSLVADCFASNLYDATGLNLTATFPSVLREFFTSSE